MTQSEKETVIQVVRWCINRIRDEQHGQDYELAADDVANKLQFLAHWLTSVPTAEESRSDIADSPGLVR